MAQNLVNNGNFEIYSNCPTASAQFYSVVNWVNAQTSTSPDYFNSCTSTNANVPNTVFGYQKDYVGGGGIAGIYAFNRNFPNQAREYIQTYLNDTLATGNKYLASMYVNPCNAYNYAIASMSMYFDKIAIQGPTNYDFINIAAPQVKNTTLLNDTLNWLLVQDTIRGTGERYLTIGNFSYDSLSDTVRVYNMGFGTSNDYAYYYVDGVSVYDVTGGACNNLWDAGFDKYIFAGDSIRLGAINTDNSSYAWQNSLGGNTFLNSNLDARPWSSPTVTTTYCVTKTCPNSGGVFTDTITVYVQPHIGIKEMGSKDADVLIFPNPNRSDFNVRYSLKQNAIMNIESMDGKVIKQLFLNSGYGNVSVSDLNLDSGIYLYRIINGQKPINGKIVVIDY